MSSDGATPNAYDIQLVHFLAVTADAKYTICFDAKATAAYALDFSIDNDSDPSWARLHSWVKPIDLTTTYTTYTTVITANATNTKARLAFNLGGKAVGVSLDNVAVYAGEVSCPATPAPVADTAAGKTTFAAKCQSCHGANGSGGSGGALSSVKTGYSESNNANVYSLETFIANFMPDNANVGTCIGQCAVNVAGYISGGFQ